MRFGRHPAILGGSGGYAFIRALQPAAWYRADSGVTVTASGASMVADQADSDNALVLPGVAGNYASAPDSVPLSITGDIDIRVRVSLDDWTPASACMMASKYAAGQISFYLQLTTLGALAFQYTSDGSTTAGRLATSSVVNGFTNGTTNWVRVTYASATGKVNFYTAADSSTEPSSWSALGVEQTITSGAIHDGTAPLEVGAFNGGTQVPIGKLYRAIIKNGIDGTTVFDANFAAQSKGTTSFSESSSNAATVTVNQSGALPAHIGSQKDLLQGTDANRPPYLSYSGTKYLYLPGVANNFASSPDSAGSSITGDIDVIVKVSADDYTPSANTTPIAKYAGAGSISYALQIKTTGVLTWFWSTDGTAVTSKDSTASTGLADGSTKWLRVTHDVDNGAAGNDVKFWMSDDGSTWAQLGSTVTTAGTTSIADTSAILGVGGLSSGGSAFSGKLYRAIIKNGIDGTTVVDFNPNLDGSDQAATITSSATGEVWTINKSGGLPAQIVGRPSLLFDGSADYLKCNAFTLNQPETVYIAFKQVSWTLNEYIFDGNATNSGALFQSATTPNIKAQAGTQFGENSGLTVGSYGVVAVVFQGASTSLIQVNNAAPVTGSSGAGNMGGFTLGTAGTPGVYGNIQVLEALIFPAAHDATQRARVIQYLAGRHGIAL